MRRLLLRVLPPALALAALLGAARPCNAQAIWDRIGLPGRVEDQRLPEAGRWGGYPGGVPVVKGDALFPRKQG